MESFVPERSNVSELFTDCASHVALTSQWAQALIPGCASHQLVLVMCRFQLWMSHHAGAGLKSMCRHWVCLWDRSLRWQTVLLWDYSSLVIPKDVWVWLITAGYLWRHIRWLPESDLVRAACGSAQWVLTSSIATFAFLLRWRPAAEHILRLDYAVLQAVLVLDQGFCWVSYAWMVAKSAVPSCNLNTTLGRAG